MVEVFKTNVNSRADARRLAGLIRQLWRGYRASFDLDDCDRVLRVENARGPVPAPPLVALLNELGFEAGVLPDEPADVSTHQKNTILNPQTNYLLS